MGLHWTVCGVVVFLMTTSVSAVVEPIMVMSDVDTVTCAEGISITDPQVCPRRSITFTCTTNETGVLVWRTSASGPDGILFVNFDGVGAMGSDIGEGLPGFTATLTDVMGLLLTSTLTTAASDEVSGLQVMCMDSILVNAASESANIPPFVEDSPSQPMTVSATNDSLGCAAGTDDFTVTWQCPAETGGAAITNFTVSVDGGSPQTFMGTATMSDPIPVSLNVEHSISVTASNCFGTGPPNSITVNPQAPVPSAPEDVQATLNCQNITLNAVTVTWNDPNTNLSCSVMSTTVDVDSGDISLSCSGTSSPSVCTGNITEGAPYTATVGFSSSLPESQSNPSTSFDQITVRRCTVDRTLRQMPDDCIQVTLDDWCEEDHTRYGVSVLNQDMSESGITRFDPSDTICVPIDPTVTFSLRLYFDNTILEQKSGITAACDCLDLIDSQLFNPLPMCSGDGDMIVGAICNGEVTYTNLAVNSGRATYQCDDGYSISGVNPRECGGDGRWSGTLPICLPEEAGLSVGAAVGIGVVLTFLVSFSAGLLVAFAIAYCYIRRQKGHYSPSDTQQPTPKQASQQGSIELKDNVSYGPVPSQPPVPQQHAPMYEEVATHVQPGNMEMKANIAYGPISH